MRLSLADAKSFWSRSRTKHLRSAGVGLLLIVGLAVLPGPSSAAVPPVLNGPLHIWVGYPAGGPADRVARLVAQHLEPRLGVPVIVENRTGAGGRLAAQGVSEASSRENVLLLSTPAAVVIAPTVFLNLGYDALKGLVPVSLVAYYEFGLAVSPGANLARIEDLPTWVRTNPRAFNIGVPGAGSLPHFFAFLIDELMSDAAQMINYRGSARMLADLMADRLPLAVDTLEALAIPHAAGKARILATSGLERHPDYPDIPTFAEAGLDIAGEGWFAFFSSAHMPPGIRRELGERISQTVRSPEVHDALAELGYEPVGLNPTETSLAIDRYRSHWIPIIRASGYEVAY